MAILYEHYNEGNDDYANFYDGYWLTQTFTPIAPHTIKSVKLLLYRSGSPGTLTVSIRATDGNGKPTGEDLCSGTTDANTLPTSPSSEWREITLGNGYNLSSSTKYAIVVRAISGSAGNRIFWLLDGSSPTYAGGSYGISYDDGSSWALDALDDMMFEEWGYRTSPLPTYFRQ